jgi:hypothetical protein
MATGIVNPTDSGAFGSGEETFLKAITPKPPDVGTSRAQGLP